jgi:trimeric autotransporter adhesin
LVGREPQASGGKADQCLGVAEGNDFRAAEITTDNRDATGKIARLRGVTWEWREDAPDEAKEQPGMGVIAQDVEKVFPALVETDDEGRKKVAYHGLIGPLIEAVKELDERLRAVEARLDTLDQRPPS